MALFIAIKIIVIVSEWFANQSSTVMGVDDFFNPHGGSTTDSFSHSPPTIVELSAQMAPLLQMQTLTPNPIQNQDPLLTTPTRPRL
ncbi:NB-ARC domain-containing disease resistance protein [Prunus dulcis]|uniref:NB-ARC domain-containing disease resistance protein n=1 Tax=Prunus dulcis TaxID=3755 RepID=A0A4Y1QPN1_PRUDU|nr:NB-ARC domain-containing disease resistance protein [Prunus dulcis]